MDAFHGGNIMKTGEARGIYSSVLKSYNEQKFKLSKQREELKERMESTPDGKTRYADEAATLELKYNAVAEKQDEYQNYVNQLMAQWEGKFNSVVAKQQGEAAKDYGEEMGKIMTVARRLMHGDQVPMQDEKKLMEYNKDLYIMAKNAGMMARLEKRKKVSAPAMVVAAAMTAMPAAAVAAVAAGPMSSAAAATALTQPGTPALAAALRGRHRLGGAKLQPALAALRAGGTRVIPAVPAAVLGGACRGFACSALGGYGAVLPVCRVLAQGLHKGIVPLRLRHSRLLHRRCVVLGVFAVLAVFAPKGTEESHCVLLSHSSVFVRSHKISPPEPPQLEFSVQDLKISWFLRAAPARFAPEKAAFFSPFRFSFCAECVIMVPAL